MPPAPKLTAPAPLKVEVLLAELVKPLLKARLPVLEMASFPAVEIPRLNVSVLLVVFEIALPLARKERDAPVVVPIV